jgi:hypothetical protein
MSLVAFKCAIPENDWPHTPGLDYIISDHVVGFRIMNRNLISHLMHSIALIQLLIVTVLVLTLWLCIFISVISEYDDNYLYCLGIL